MNERSDCQALYEYKRIVLLANSRKHSDRCIAGREVNEGGFSGWIRPVSARSGESVNWQERSYGLTMEPQLLDVIDVPIRRHKPHGNQTENWLLYPYSQWKKVGVLNYAQAKQLAETPAALWNTGFSTSNNLNDKVSAESAKAFTNSICMIKVDALSMRVWAPGLAFGDRKRRVQASFSYSGVNYAMWLTDAALEHAILNGKDGYFDCRECLITVSLSEPHDLGGIINHYKLAAAIIFPDS